MCNRSLSYSRLSSAGDLLVENRNLGFAQEVEGCDVYFPSWRVDEDGNPVILAFNETEDNPGVAFGVGCVLDCRHTVDRTADGTLYAVGIHSAFDQFGTSFNRVTLYALPPGTTVHQKVAVIASNWWGDPVSFPPNPVLVGAALVGTGLFASGVVGFIRLRAKGR